MRFTVSSTKWVLLFLPLTNSAMALSSTEAVRCWPKNLPSTVCALMAVASILGISVLRQDTNKSVAKAPLVVVV